MGLAAQSSSDWLLSFANPVAWSPTAPSMARALEVFAHTVEVRGKPAFDLHTTIVDGVSVPVTEAVVLRKPFGQLKYFQREVTGRRDPRILIVAPMSGHYATLLRGTVERMLESAEVFITDWADAKMVPLSAGRFDLDDYIDYLIDFAEHVHLEANGGEAGGQRIHMMAVCQPSVPAFAATALMNLHKSPATPATLTMMGGPIDARKSPTSVNNLATNKSFEWFENNVIYRVPPNFPGAGRRVYPGFLQYTGFVAMNPDRHANSHYDYFKDLIKGDGASVEAHRKFYDEYNAVLDMDADYYLETIATVFQDFKLVRGTWDVRSEDGEIERVRPQDITGCGLLTVEGELDDSHHRSTVSGWRFDQLPWQQC